MDEVQNQEAIKTEETTEQPAEGLMSNASLEKEETTQDEGMATKSVDQVVEGEDLENDEDENDEDETEEQEVRRFRRHTPQQAKVDSKGCSR